MAGEQFAQEGQRVKLKDGTEAVVTNGQLVAVAAKPGSAGKKGLSVQAQNFLNPLSTQASEAAETQRLYDQAAGAIKTLKPGPNRGRFLEIATPEEGGGFLDTLGGLVVGAPARAIGAITPEETDAYQNLRRLQSSQVLGQQLLQKGPQTESDAARLQLTELSPSKSQKVNEDVIKAGNAKMDRVRAKAIFYTKFANNWGLNGVSPDGFTADQLWAKSADYITKKLLGHEAGKKGAPKGTRKIKVLSRETVK